MSDVTIVPVGFQKTVVAVEDKVSVVVAAMRGPKGDNGDATNLANYYTKTEVDGLLDGKADAIHLHVVEDITNFSTAHINGGVF